MSDLAALARSALELTGEKNLSFVTAESCTGGKLCALLSEVPGATELPHSRFVIYTKVEEITCAWRFRRLAQAEKRGVAAATA